MQVDEIKTALAEMKSAVEKARTDMEGSVKEQVEKALKEILRNNPLAGNAPARVIPFGVDGGENPTVELVKQMPTEIAYAADSLFITSKLLKCDPRQLKQWDPFKRLFEAKAGDLKKALDSTTAGGVDEWVPTEMSSQLIEKVRAALRVAAVFPVIPMPSQPYELPVELGDLMSFLFTEQTADTGQTLIPVGDADDNDAAINISGKITFTAKDHGTRILVSKNAMADSIVSLMPFIQNRIILALAQGREDATINGDTTGSHMDSDVTASKSRRKLFKGLRRLASDGGYTADLSTLSVDAIIDMIGTMGVYGENPADQVFITGFRGITNLMKISEFKTLDKMGPRAVILSGQIGELLGRPVIISSYVRQDLNASGVYESGQTKTALLLAHKNAFAYGERGGIETQVLFEKYAESRQNALIATERVDFQPLYAVASNPTVVAGINLG